MTSRRSILGGTVSLGALALGIFAACGSDDSGGKPSASGDAGTGGESGVEAGAGGRGAGGGSDTGAPSCPSTAPLLEEDCDPLGGFCGLPFPSDVYLRDDPTGKNHSGKSVRFGPATLPRTGEGKQVAADMLYELDGFSPASTAMAYLPGATATGLPTPLELSRSATKDSPSILLEVSTGRLVPHFVDVDEQQTDPAKVTERLVLLHPAELLKNGERYIVAFRNVKDASGATLPPPDAFRALRDGTASTEPSVGSRRCHYEDIFAKLDAADVPKEDLQIAWDFTVGSREAITGPMIKVRDAALAAAGTDGPTFTVKEVEEAPNRYIKRRIVLTMTTPTYLDPPDYAAGGAVVPRLKFDATTGAATATGSMEVDVLVQIPNSVDGGEPHGLLQNGHGLFGSKDEGRNGYLAMAADGWKWITLAVDYFGFSENDLGVAAEGLTGRPEMLPGFMDRQVQGQVNQLVAMRMMMTRVATEGVRDTGGTLILDPAWINKELRAYRGDSQGGIMGGTYMSVSTDVTRGLLGEPGTPYSVLLNRSKDSTLYNGLLKNTYGDQRNVQLLWSLIQLFWDRSEPSGFVPHMTDNPLPGTPPHHVLIHPALGDHQVTTLGAHIMARAVGAKAIESNDPTNPIIREIYGLEQVAGPLQDESAIVEWEFGLPPEPLGNVPPLAGCDPHDRVRVLTPAFEQQDHFFRTGEISWYCDGICNCDGPREEANCGQSYKDQCRDVYCAELAAACTGANAQSATTAECETAAGGYDVSGTWGAMTGNTLQCRLTHLELAKSTPADHCVHAGPSGAGACE